MARRVDAIVVAGPQKTYGKDVRARDGVTFAGEALPGTNWGEMGAFVLLLLVFAGATASFATWSVRAYQRTL